MNISKRLLTKWRKEALRANVIYKHDPDDCTSLVEGSTVIELSKRILKLTQILLDQHMMKGE